jgi:hypothetical protein
LASTEAGALEDAVDATPFDDWVDDDWVDEDWVDDCETVVFSTLLALTKLMSLEMTVVAGGGEVSVLVAGIRLLG